MIDLDDAIEPNAHVSRAAGIPHRRTLLLVAVTAVVAIVVAIVIFHSSNGLSDQDLREMGYTPLVAVEDTNIWVNSAEPGKVGVLTNGRLGILCNSETVTVENLLCSPTARTPDKVLALTYLDEKAQQAQVQYKGRTVELTIVDSPAGIGPAGTKWGYALVSPPMNINVALIVDGQKAIPTIFRP